MGGWPVGTQYRRDRTLEILPNTIQYYALRPSGVDSHHLFLSAHSIQRLHCMPSPCVPWCVYTLFSQRSLQSQLSHPQLGLILIATADSEQLHYSCQSLQPSHHFRKQSPFPQHPIYLPSLTQSLSKTTQLSAFHQPHSRPLLRSTHLRTRRYCANTHVLQPAPSSFFTSLPL